MDFKSRKFISVCAISSFLIAGLVSTGFADSYRENDPGEKRDREHKVRPTQTLKPTPPDATDRRSRLHQHLPPSPPSIIMGGMGSATLRSLSAAQLSALAAGQ